MITDCDVCIAIPKNVYVLLETEHWVVSLAQDQTLLGRSYVTAKTHTSSIRELSKEQWDDLHCVMATFEKAVTNAFGAVLFNWACLMNDAYKEAANPQSPHVHWHARPRYSTPVTIHGETFTDEHFGKHYKTRWDGKVDRKPSADIMQAITTAIHAGM